MNWENSTSIEIMPTGLATALVAALVGNQGDLAAMIGMTRGWPTYVIMEPAIVPASGDRRQHFLVIAGEGELGSCTIVDVQLRGSRQIYYRSTRQGRSMFFNSVSHNASIIARFSYL